jgi:hypothetical protein
MSNTDSLHKKNERGTATVEVALMLPVYVFLTISLLFLGSFQLTNLRMIRDVAYISQKPGEQSFDNMEEESSLQAIYDDLISLPTANFPNAFQGPFMTDALTSDLFSSTDLLEMYNDATYRVTGRYSLQGTQIVYSTSMSVSGVGALNEKYKMSDLREDLNTELGNFLQRSQTHLELEMRLPFSDVIGSDNQTHSEIDYQSHLWGTLVHDHRDVIRKPTSSSDHRPFTRVNFLDTQSAGDDTRAVDRLLGQSWAPETLNDQFRTFWSTDWQPDAN